MMYDGLDMAQGLMEAIDAADELLEQLAECGRKKAEAEREYRMAKRTRTLYERANGAPVSIIGDLVKGYADIANLALARDCAEAEYEATREAIMLNKRKIDIYREQLAREFGRRE